MNLEFHHVNLASNQIPRMEEFYGKILGLEVATDRLSGMRILDDYSAGTTFIQAGPVQLHLAESDPTLGFRTGHVVNPVLTGHIAFRTDDIEKAKHTLAEHNVQFSDYGVFAMKGWHQIFFYDPHLNVVEIHQEL